MFKPIELLNVIDSAYQDEIYRTVTDVKFPWHFLEDTTFERSNDPNVSTPSFVNLVYHPNNESNPHYEFFKPLLDNILDKTGYELQSLLRMRLGFLMNTKYALPQLQYKHNTPHRDFEQEHWTAIYYVNQADGDTVIFHEIEQAERYRPMHKSTPEKGKLLLFNGWHYHASSCPKMFAKRIALTINFTAKKT